MQYGAYALRENVSISATEEKVLLLLEDQGEKCGIEVALSSNIKRGTVYVTLARMENKGLVTSRLEPPNKGERGPARRVFTLTRFERRVLNGCCLPRASKKERNVLCVLLAHGEMRACDIATHSDTKRGTVYAMLARMMNKGLVISRNLPPKRGLSGRPIYGVSENGSQLIRALQSNVRHG